MIFQTDKGGFMHTPFFDLKVTNPSLKKELLNAVEGVLNHGRILFGPEVQEFERKVAQAAGTKYAVGVASGSSALYLALKCLDIGPGDEVITTPLTWIITGNAIVECGADPVFVDIKDDFNIDPKSIEQAITDKTKAIVPVHFTGLMCEMDKICGIAERFNIPVIEDAAQAYGAEYDSKKAGSFSTVAALSMNSMKVLGGYGETGAVVTNRKDLYKKLKMLRYTGTKSDPSKIITNEAIYVSLNHKIDTIQAAMLLVMMKHLPDRMKRRTEIAKRYNEALSDLVVCPKFRDGDIHALYTYAIQCDRRDHLMNQLNNNGIETKIYHKPLVSDAPVFRKYKRNGTHNAQKVLNRFLSIPAHEKLSNEQVEFVIDNIKAFYS
jgi:dTDP-4-amino-4,6-dideoxygalactose transaminase